MTVGLRSLDGQVVDCRACPRLVGWRERVAQEKRRSFADEEYWGRPVPGFGPADAAVLVVGLAPAAHGANRTGRMFTGDRSGDWLYAAMHRAGLASQPLSTDRNDGLQLYRARVTAAVHCVPPDNKPTTLERDACAQWLQREVELLRPTLRVLVGLGSFAWGSTLTAVAAAGWIVPRPRPRFGHGEQVDLEGPPGLTEVTGLTGLTGLTVLASYHPSQQNTFTGRLTRPMLDEVFQRAADLAGVGREGPASSRR